MKDSFMGVPVIAAMWEAIRKGKDRWAWVERDRQSIKGCPLSSMSALKFE